MTVPSCFPLSFLIPIAALGAPLTVFDQADLGGTGTVIPQTYTIYSGSGIPNSLEDRISSFRLNAGHMAVLATSASGLGPGKTYIAEGDDLIVRMLPEDLANAVSFIRVIPWRSTMKKGTGGDLSAYPSVEASWSYRWGFNVANGLAVDSREYVPMSWGAGGAGDEHIPDYLAMNQVIHLLGFNESDNCSGQSGQWNNLCDVPTAVSFYQNLQKTGLRLGSPAPREGGAKNPTSWLSQFIDQAEAADVRIDFVALHWYDWDSNPAANPVVPAEAVFERFQRYLSNAYHMYRRPLWITEFNANPNRGTAIQNGFMELALPYLESLGYVERYAWFQPSSGTGDFFDGDELSSTGQIYRNQASTAAYASETLPSVWQGKDIGAVAEPGQTIHSNGTFTVCGSGAGIGGGADAFHYAYQSLTGDGTIVAYVETILRRGNSKAGLMIRETLDAESKHGSMFLSESGEVAFEHRSSSGGNSQRAVQAGIQAPCWLKLKREGDTLSGYYSSDAQTWIRLTSQSVPMNAAVYAGLAVSSQDNATFCDAVFKVPDFDDDRLPDTWELAFFGDLAKSQGASGNFDRDFYTDWEEFIFGTDPADPESFFSPSLTGADSGYLQVLFDGVAGRTYSLEVSDSLIPGSWVPVDSVTPVADGQQMLDHGDPDNPDTLFGRIRANRD